MKSEIFNQYRYCFARNSTPINILCTHFESFEKIKAIKEWTMIYSTWLDLINNIIRITYQSWHRIQSQLQDVLEFKEMMTSHAVIIAYLFEWRFHMILLSNGTQVDDINHLWICEGDSSFEPWLLLFLSLSTELNLHEGFYKWDLYIMHSSIVAFLLYEIDTCPPVIKSRETWSTRIKKTINEVSSWAWWLRNDVSVNIKILLWVITSDTLYLHKFSETLKFIEYDTNLGLSRIWGLSRNSIILSSVWLIDWESSIFNWSSKKCFRRTRSCWKIKIIRSVSSDKNTKRNHTIFMGTITKRFKQK